MHRHWSESLSLIVPKNGRRRRPQNIFCVFEITLLRVARTSGLDSLFLCSCCCCSDGLISIFYLKFLTLAELHYRDLVRILILWVLSGNIIFPYN